MTQMEPLLAQAASIAEGYTHFDLVTPGGLRQPCAWEDVDLGVVKLLRLRRLVLLVDLPLGTKVENLRREDRRAQPVGAQWESYRAEVMPKDSGEVQERESKRAFYAGARAMLSILATLNDPTELAAIEAELAAYVAEVQAGRA